AGRDAGPERARAEGPGARVDAADRGRTDGVRGPAAAVDRPELPAEPGAYPELHGELRPRDGGRCLGRRHGAHGGPLADGRAGGTRHGGVQTAPEGPRMGGVRHRDQRRVPGAELSRLVHEDHPGPWLSRTVDPDAQSHRADGERSRWRHGGALTRTDVPRSARAAIPMETGRNWPVAR